MAYIVEMNNGDSPYWLAPWTGDPGRTVVRHNAMPFRTVDEAEMALRLAQKRYGTERKSLMQGQIVPK
jgi:hypothetical protein